MRYRRAIFPFGILALLPHGAFACEAEGWFADYGTGLLVAMLVVAAILSAMIAGALGIEAKGKRIAVFCALFLVLGFLGWAAVAIVGDAVGLC